VNGIICVDKPQGFTSFDVIGKLRGILKMRRLGHSGTLDPMATGVLPVFVGGATKACGILPDGRKAYTAQFRLGQETDTQDSTGTLLKTHDFCGITAKAIEAALLPMVGDIEQLPPMYSAVSVGGRRLYELAREGKTVERKPRQVHIDSLVLTQFDAQKGTGTLQIACGTGVYVRTVLHDVGQALGCGAVMTGLRRTMSNGLTLDTCVTIETLEHLAAEGHLEEALLPIERLFDSLPRICLNRSQTVHYRNGVKLGLSQLRSQLTQAQRYAVYGDPDGFLGTAVTDKAENCLRVERNLSTPAGTVS
jgi:tRNA pseudouridine55 synthase